ncbi:MAG TPA: hypothetical protein PLL33_02075 [Paracoccus sp. (in: a-proteobacteria)]|nr:hypothetical protein [Paracoccus sp. (in: a-proteobacteria)]
MQVQMRGAQPLVRDVERTADRLESAFLAEMLKHAAPQGWDGAFGGGVGESQFASFMTEQQAGMLAQALDLRLAEALGKRDG